MDSARTGSGGDAGKNDKEEKETKDEDATKPDDATEPETKGEDASKDATKPEDAIEPKPKKQKIKKEHETKDADAADTTEHVTKDADAAKPETKGDNEGATKPETKAEDATKPETTDATKPETTDANKPETTDANKPWEWWYEGAHKEGKWALFLRTSSKDKSQILEFAAKDDEERDKIMKTVQRALKVHVKGRKGLIRDCDKKELIEWRALAKAARDGC